MVLPAVRWLHRPFWEMATKNQGAVAAKGGTASAPSANSVVEGGNLPVVIEDDDPPGIRCLARTPESAVVSRDRNDRSRALGLACR